MSKDSPQLSKSVVARYFDMWNSGDTSAVADLLRDDWMDHSHPEVTGPESVREAVTRARATRPDLHFTIMALLGQDVHGELVAAVGSVGHPSEVTDDTARLIWLVRLEDGRMAEMWTYRA